MARDPGQMGPRNRAQFRGESIGFVFQGFNLLPTLSAEDNVTVPLLIGGVARRCDRQARARFSTSSGWAHGLTLGLHN